jgi:hypothetical protein
MLNHGQKANKECDANITFVVAYVKIYNEEEEEEEEEV